VSLNDSIPRIDLSESSKKIPQQIIQARSHSLPSTPTRKDKSKANIPSLSQSKKTNEVKHEKTKESQTSMSLSKNVALIQSDTSSQSQSQSHPLLEQNSENSSIETSIKNEKQLQTPSLLFTKMIHVMISFFDCFFCLIQATSYSKSSHTAEKQR
jgi:hypothetical protein